MKDGECAEWIAAVRSGNAVEAERAARSLRELATRAPGELRSRREELIKLAFAAGDLRVRWNLIQILGNLGLKGRQRAVAVGWLFERLRDASPLTRTWALQAVADLSEGDAGLRARVRAVAEEFAENGTAAMRARARKILAAHSSRGAKTR